MLIMNSSTITSHKMLVTESNRLGGVPVSSSHCSSPLAASLSVLHWESEELEALSLSHVVATPNTMVNYDMDI